MYKVLRSYSRKSERKHDATGQPPQHTVESSQYHQSNGGGGVGGPTGPQFSRGGRLDDAPFVTSPPPSVRNGGGVHSLRRGSRERSAGADYNSTYSTEWREENRGGAASQRNGQVRHHRSAERADAGRYYDTAFSAHSGHGGRYNQSTEHHQVHRHSARGEGYSESSSYETREHFERKVVKKKKQAQQQAIKSNGEVRMIKVGFGVAFPPMVVFVRLVELGDGCVGWDGWIEGKNSGR